MAMEGLFALACAGAVVVAAPQVPVASAGEGSIAATLAVQTAMQQAREYLLRNNAKAAVEVLERQLPLVNGNQSYLAMLRDAYKAYIKDLKLNNQEALARVYMDNLSILEPSAVPRTIARGAEPSAAPAPPTPPASAVTARGYREEKEDSSRLAAADKDAAARTVLARAEQQFTERHFHEAALLYEQAHQADPDMAEASRQRWAYCKLHQVVDQLNQESPDYAAMEADVNAALRLAPRLDYGKTLLGEIGKRRGEGAATGRRDGDRPADIPVRHLGANADGWSVAETENFRVFHKQPRELAEQAARVAERTRAAMQRRWFGRTGPAWNPKCDLFLHASGADYSKATGAPANSPGHSSFRIEGGQVVGRRIDLHCDDLNMLGAVLPHETTHTVIAGNLGDQPVPRWADEGMAVLTEPRDKIDRHLRKLPAYREQRQLFSVGQLMQMNEYPDARYVGAFYAQSVSVVEFLTTQTRKSPEEFTQFVRDGLRDGYETSLRRHYGYNSFAELEQKWAEYAFSDVSTRQGVAQGNR